MAAPISVSYSDSGVSAEVSFVGRIVCEIVFG